MPEVVVALLTPHGDTGALRAHVDFLCDAGVDALMPCGTTGEGALLEEEEVAELTAATVAAARGRARVLAHVGRPATEATVRLAGRALAADLGPNVTKWVKEEPDEFLALLGDAEPGTKLAELCRSKLGQLTFQRAGMIEGVIRDVVQRDAPWSRAADILSEGHGTWDAEAVKHKLDEIVERRHRIAHSGDMLPNSTATRPIQRPYVEVAVRVINAAGVAVTQTLA